ncbi:hypothetical protein GOBAR_AA36915 [Gossypium barbadense]|uniref:Uncharacterized protein n=1 Tax=Gossypium barbadense TaxID=3634 RepID=A0A2P5VYA6_GOSBA|nr:hypothetical protein GOBAR_AA36915 [Gossypium barbadense]
MHVDHVTHSRAFLGSSRLTSRQRLRTDDSPYWPLLASVPLNRRGPHFCAALRFNDSIRRSLACHRLLPIMRSWAFARTLYSAFLTASLPLPSRRFTFRFLAAYFGAFATLHSAPAAFFRRYASLCLAHEHTLSTYG